LSTLVLAAVGSVQASPLLWAAALALLWVASVATPRARESAGRTALTYGVWFLAVWMVATNLWTNAAYTAAAPYHAAFLAGGVLLGRRGGPENAGHLFRVGLVFAGLLALWALWQWLAGGSARAHAPFETPATLAATINLVLLPGLVILVCGKRHWALVAMLVLLSTALAASQSRGGALAFALSGLATLALARRAGLFSSGREVILRTGAVLTAGLALAQLMPWLFDRFVFATGPLHPVLSGAPREPGYAMIGADAFASWAARLELYTIAWRGIETAPPLFGSGYLAFHYLLEQGREGLSAYGGSTTYFVHNDYLQTLLELGIPGAIGLLALAALPFSKAWYAAPRISLNPAVGLALVAPVAALSSMAVHALMDYPFYVPVCLLVFGTALGMLDSVLLCALAGGKGPRPPVSIVMTRLRGAGGAAAVTLVLWILALPLAAEATAGYAQRQWRAAHGASAAYWFEVARRLEPGDWRYHWYAGRFWYLQAMQNLKPDAAALADRAFAEGDAANPREVRNLLGRIATHRELRAFLANPADPVALRAWVKRAVQLAPLDPGVDAERALVLKQFGSPGEELPK
jgi:hypothetical protein